MTNSASNGISGPCTIIDEGESLIVRRRQPGKMYRGKYKPSNRFEEFEAQFSFQPMSGRETMQLPEGDREKVHIKAYTPFQVKRDDIIERNGEEYEVQAVDNWGTYTKSIARLIDVKRN